MSNEISDFLFIYKYLSKKRLFIFGAGPMGEELSKELELFSINLMGFVDNNKSKWGQVINGLEVVSPENLLLFSKDEIFIIPAVRDFDSVSEQLSGMGFINGKHYVDENLFGKKAEKLERDCIYSDDSRQTFTAENSAAQTLADIYKSASKKSNDYVAYNEEGITLDEDDVKLIAFYLPQFHPFKENDEWWGKGFTEWTNVTKSAPQFIGHYQPHLPDELGFYDLRVETVQERQVELARHYGIHGFCFHYYNFGGKRLLESPLDTFVENENNHFPFCICWANEPWTRGWDGSEHLILMDQPHSLENDTAVIYDMIDLFKNKNYIKINNKPLLIVYRVGLLPELQKTIENWNLILQNEGFSGVYLVAAQARGFTDPVEINFDAAVEFPPHRMPGSTEITNEKTIANPEFAGRIFDYKSFVEREEYLEEATYKVFKTAFPNWDNTARKPNNGLIFHGSTPNLYQLWLENIIRFSSERKESNEDNFVFINAWNEWAEGAHLEPDRKYGYAYLQATANAIKASRKK